DHLIGIVQRLLDGWVQNMTAVNENMAMHGTEQADHPHRAAMHILSIFKRFVARGQQLESRSMLDQHAADNRFIKPGEILREVLQPLRSMQIQKESQLAP